MPKPPHPVSRWLRLGSILIGGACLGSSCSENSSSPPPVTETPKAVQNKTDLATDAVRNNPELAAEKNLPDSPMQLKELPAAATQQTIPSRPVAEVLKLQRERIEVLGRQLEGQLKGEGVSTGDFQLLIKTLRANFPGVERKSTLIADLASTEQVCNRIEAELPARKEKLSPEAYSLIQNLIGKSRTEIDQIKSMQADYFAKITLVDEAADQWTLVYEEIRKLSGKETAQKEVDSEIRRFLQSNIMVAPKGTGWHSPEDYQSVKNKLGLMVTLNPLGRPRDILTGVKLESILQGSPSEQAGLQAGDVILRLNGQTILNKGDLGRFCASLKGGETLNIKIQRGKDEKILKLVTGSVMVVGEEKKP